MVSALNSQTRDLKKIRARKIPRQKELFMHAAPVRVESDIVMVCLVFFLA